MKATTIKTVNPEPVVKTEKKEELVTIFLDPQMVGKTGIRINGKLFIGEVTVPRGEATNLLRMQEEYWETVKKLTNKMVVVRMKSDFQKEKLFLADPAENERKTSFTRDYGLLGQYEWSLCAPKFKDYLLATRKQMYGY